MKVLLNILNSEKTNLGKLELVKAIEDAIIKKAIPSFKRNEDINLSK